MIDIDGEITPEEQASIDIQVAGFYKTGGWTEERLARWAPFQRLIDQTRAERAAAEKAAQDGAEPAAA